MIAIPSPKIRFGMHAMFWTPVWTPEAAERVVPAAARAGLGVVELSVSKPEIIDAPHSVKLFSDHGIAPVCSAGIPPDIGNPLDPPRVTAFLIRAVAKAHELGATLVTGLTYTSFGYRTGKPPTEKEYDAIVAALKPVARRAADWGMSFGIEPINRFETHLVNTAAQGVALADRIGEPNVIVHLDTYHMNIEEKGLPAGLEAARGRCRYLHLSESDRSIPGKGGTIDWDGFFRAVKDTGFEGDLVIEPFLTVAPEVRFKLCIWRPLADDPNEMITVGIPFLQGKARRYGLLPAR
jgi:D-psicose/D-tagatose/L-ribulose 3-epimerase